MWLVRIMPHVGVLRTRYGLLIFVYHVSNIMPQQAKNWKIYPPAPADFLENNPEHPLLLQVLYNRGLRSAAEIKPFLAGSDAVRENPYKLRDMPIAVQRLVRAIQTEQTICVYGDFDADGVTATALLTTALQSAGGRVGPYIPDRVDEGYGLNSAAIERIAAKADIMVTVDCGIRSVEEVALANAVGLDVIITDHHSVGPELPPALAVINPRRADCTSNFKRLAGVGVAYRLSQAVLRAVSQQRWSDLTPDRASELEESLLDYVALGTVADVMPLLGENRSLVQRGLAMLNNTQRPGLQALMAKSDVSPGSADATAIAFRLAPRINAAGRLSKTTLAYRLLRTPDKSEAYKLSNQLEALNQQRRDFTATAQAEAEQLLIADEAQKAVGERSLYMVSSPNFQSGIVGLVAGRLMDRYYRPTIVIEQGDDESRGSARSIAEFDISAALDEVSDLLLRHGGHSRAAGFTVETAKLNEFHAALEAVAERELDSYGNLRPTLMVDAEVSLNEINWGLQEQFARLEPTGNENPTPLLLVQNCRVRDIRKLSGGKHLRLILDVVNGSGATNDQVVDAVAFNLGEWASVLDEERAIDLVCQVEVNEWQGRRRLQMNIQDLRLSED